MRIKPFLITLVAVMLIAGCSSNNVQLANDGVTSVEELSLVTQARAKYRAELRTAKKIAEESNDRMGIMCMGELIDRADARDTEVSTKPTGVMSTLMAIRAKRRGLEDGVSDDLRIACAPLVSSIVKSVSKLMSAALRRLATGGLR